jgi:DNA-binding GntR family transcriptional regulator
MGAVKSKSPKRATKRKVARHKVRDSIEKMILEERIKPGEKIVQLQLSRMFNVSLGMIREALFELQRSGLIEAFDNRGIFVRKIDPETIREFCTVRELFEGLAARECCGKLKPQDATDLLRMVDEVYRLAISGRQAEKAAVDREFHSRIVQISGNRLLVGMSQQYRVLGKIVGTSTDPQETRDSHIEIIKAIESEDPLKAEFAAREHVRRVLHVIEEKLRTGARDLQWLT